MHHRRKTQKRIGFLSGIFGKAMSVVGSYKSRKHGKKPRHSRRHHTGKRRY
jgi:hypothetical protein